MKTPKPDSRRKRLFSHVGGVSRTEAAMGPAADINTIVSRGARSGVYGTGMQGTHAPMFVDLVGWDYQAALHKVSEARQMFQRLPSAVRARFGNDPQQLLDFLANPKNEEEARFLGLLPAKAPAPPPPAEKPLEGAGDGTIPLS